MFCLTALRELHSLSSWQYWPPLQQMHFLWLTYLFFDPIPSTSRPVHRLVYLAAKWKDLPCFSFILHIIFERILSHVCLIHYTSYLSQSKPFFVMFARSSNVSVYCSLLHVSSHLLSSEAGHIKYGTEMDQEDTKIVKEWHTNLSSH